MFIFYDIMASWHHGHVSIVLIIAMVCVTLLQYFSQRCRVGIYFALYIVMITHPTITRNLLNLVTVNGLLHNNLRAVGAPSISRMVSGTYQYHGAYCFRRLDQSYNHHRLYGLIDTNRQWTKAISITNTI